MQVYNYQLAASQALVIANNAWLYSTITDSENVINKHK